MKRRQYPSAPMAAEGKNPCSEVLKVEEFTEFFKYADTTPDVAGFDHDFMENIGRFISRFDGGSPIRICDVLDEILNAPISLDETKKSVNR